MKLKNILKEFTIPMDDGGPFDDMTSRDVEDHMPSERDKRMHDRERIPATPRRNSNVKKAQRIRNAVQTLKRERSSAGKDDEVDNTINQGETEPVKASHGSNFLFR